MNGIKGSTRAAAMFCISGGLSPPRALGESKPMENNLLSTGYVTARDQALTEALSNSGFVDLTAGVRVNFRTLVGDGLDGSGGIEDLGPSLAAELLAWVQGRLNGDSDTAGAAQARVEPRRAIGLLE
jgi:hypothetical protein